MKEIKNIRELTADLGRVYAELRAREIEIKEEEIQYLNKFVQETADSAGKEAHRVETAGLQLLDGVQATTYARIRSTAESPVRRSRRYLFSMPMANNFADSK